MSSERYFCYHIHEIKNLSKSKDENILLKLILNQTSHIKHNRGVTASITQHHFLMHTVHNKLELSPFSHEQIGPQLSADWTRIIWV